jgi:D-glycero-alpha-D-manno-heptose-7-phosphate kinase
MIITRTPFRVSFFGGGTDYPLWYKDNPGAVLSTTINKYCYIMCRYLPPFFKYKYNVRYRRTERKKYISEINHPTVRECLNYMNISKGVELVHTADIPACSGVGSSSSFTVGFINALYALQGKMVTKRILSNDAIYVEQKLVKENVGSQDQIAASFGGLNKISFNGDSYVVDKIILPKEKVLKLQNNIMMFFTGFSRTSSKVAGEYVPKLPTSKRKELREMYSLVDDSIEILKSNNIDNFGKLINESWKIKKSFSNVISNKKIDDMYDCAMRNGALGGKLCGAGNGGFFILYVPEEYQDEVKRAMKKVLFVPVKFDELGSQVILYHQQDF